MLRKKLNYDDGEEKARGDLINFQPMLAIIFKKLIQHGLS